MSNFVTDRDLLDDAMAWADKLNKPFTQCLEDYALNLQLDVIAKHGDIEGVLISHMFSVLVGESPVLVSASGMVLKFVPGSFWVVLA